jgi:hypothetical protein
MVSSKHNDVLFDAAIAGITAGALAGKDWTQINSASLATAGGVAQQAAILAAAQEVDLAIPFDATLSVSSGDGTLLVTPNFAGEGTAAEILPVISKPLLLKACCESAFQGATMNGVAASYSVIAASIAAQYAAAVTQLAAS